MTKTEDFKNYYDIQGNLLSGDVTLSVDPETQETMIYVGGIRVFRIVDNKAKVKITIYSNEEVSHSQVVGAVVSKSPEVMFAYQEFNTVVLPELTNFRLEINPAKGNLAVFKQMPDNSWATADLGDTNRFVIAGGGTYLFMVKHFEGEGWTFQALHTFLGLKATRIDITVQTD
ncbi:hypothetical protein PHABIO_92 [Pseudomonas phage Phabio]|uniref:Uncharacterized protein n=1 Tax=Pseudomonas phage Phabio TaxID=2006668 RepID=A0A1Y0SYA0_9CAUD|nr:hypothetical protein MZD05_gp092 [Pseudomonas phage Phabio]ARV76723.1 hypothetical protein PHABIO_92 [Pseudomonas phage Phabio]